VTDLNELIVRLDQAVAQNTGLQAYDAEARAGNTSSPAPDPAAAASATPGPAEAAPPAEAKSTEVQVVELAPAAASNAGRMKPAIPFHLAKAKLPMPVSGRRVLAYGEQTQYGSKSKGLVLETRSGAQVTSPCDGWIVYAGEFRSYGKLLIVNAGGGYHILLAGLSHIDVQPGEFILAAEPVGIMSTTKKEPAGAASAAPVLYVEFRKDGQPIDPDPWWVKVSQKAQG
jgi:septal ring factor EnvC (AmiA/AmiB activator)